MLTSRLIVDFYPGFGFFLTRQDTEASSIVMHFSCSDNPTNVGNTFRNILEMTEGDVEIGFLPKYIQQTLQSIQDNGIMPDIFFTANGEATSFNSFGKRKVAKYREAKLDDWF